MSETTIRVEAIRIARHRQNHGSCLALANSIRDEGQRHPVALWSDNTLISGERRAFAHLLIEKPRIQAVFVNTLEDAAKHLLGDNQDDYLAMKPKWSEVCKLWQTLRRLDEPAAVKRADENRRRGVELRKLTQAGARQPGRSTKHSDDYVLTVVCEPYGISTATASRVEFVWRTANGIVEATDEQRALAREIMAEIDNGESIWAGYQRLRGDRPAPVSRPRAVVPVEPAAAVRQTGAWARSLPQLEGLVAGLIELGPPNPELTWEQVGPVHARLTAVRREMEKMIRQMKEINQS